MVWQFGEEFFCAVFVTVLAEDYLVPLRNGKKKRLTTAGAFVTTHPTLSSPPLFVRPLPISFLGQHNNAKRSVGVMARTESNAVCEGVFLL